MAVTSKDVLKLMESWVGMSRSKGTHKEIIDIYNSHTPRARGYKASYVDDYCDIAVSAVFIKLGAVDLIGGTECGVEKHVQILKNKGIWIEDGTVTPEPGDIVCFNWDDSTQANDGSADHIGFVYAVNKSNGTITFIEANMSGGVVGYRYNVPIGWGYIRGYARPKYAKETPVASKSIDTIAREVIAGKWGNGDVRTNKLRQAGYNPSEVQKRVNAILSGSAQKPAKSNTVIATEVIAGVWGNGEDRKRRLEAAGYNYSAIQAEVDKMLSKKPSKSIDTVAREVIAGKWGNGADRVAKLKKAGYNPDAVQKRVNQLL